MNDRFGIDLNPIHAVSHVVEDFADVTTSIIDRIPGGKELRGAVKDFANTSAGKTFFRALATAMAQGLTPYVGAALASISFAIPGFAAGDDDFVNSWMTEFKWRIETTAQYLGGDDGKKVGDAITSGLDKVREEQEVKLGTAAVGRAGSTELIALSQAAAELRAEGFDHITESADHLANRLGISLDSAEMIISAYNHTPIPGRDGFIMAIEMGRAKPKEYKGMGHAKGARSLVSASTGMSAAEAAGTSPSTVTTLAAMNAPSKEDVPHEAQKDSTTAKKIVLPLGGLAIGAGGALAAGLALPFVAGIGAGGLALGWLLGKR